MDKAKIILPLIFLILVGIIYLNERAFEASLESQVAQHEEDLSSEPKGVVKKTHQSAGEDLRVQIRAGEASAPRETLDLEPLASKALETVRDDDFAVKVENEKGMTPKEKNSHSSPPKQEQEDRSSFSDTKTSLSSPNSKERVTGSTSPARVESEPSKKREGKFHQERGWEASGLKTREQEFRKKIKSFYETKGIFAGQYRMVEILDSWEEYGPNNSIWVHCKYRYDKIKGNNKGIDERKFVFEFNDLGEYDITKMSDHKTADFEFR